MKIAFLTPGTGSYYCGACMRDNTLGRGLSRLGHDVTIAPMYLPLTLDDEAHAGLAGTPVFFGGINIYLQQKFALFRRTPAVLDRLLNTTGLLRWASRHSHMTSARDHGELSLEMLNVGASPLHKELDRLLDWLAGVVKPELVCLSNALLAGFTPVIRRRLGVPVVVFFQGEDLFLDGLPEPYRSRCWTALKERLAESDLLIAPSRFYAEFMRGRLGLAADAIAVVSNGIRLDGLAPAVAAPAGPPAIGYFARLCRDKGLEVFVDAFIHLAGELGDREAVAKIAGAATAADERLIGELKQRLDRAGLAGRVTWAPNVTREGKIDFLRSLSMFTVPATYAEAFGLYVIEAMACGVPVVQPDAAAYAEIVAATGGGVCVQPTAAALAQGWQELLRDPARRAALGRAGRAGVEKLFSDARMCEQFLEVAGRLPKATG